MFFIFYSDIEYLLHERAFEFMRLYEMFAMPSRYLDTKLFKQLP